MIKRVLGLALLFGAIICQAQEHVTAEPQMADKFREDGKIYVVITVIVMVFLAIVIFLIALERKIKKIENQINDKN
jgi:heme/copper-type cytochrome/quinol oxidase subunit 2